ncbi:MAG TPA: chromate resistance protein [Candidatus Paceibacterota bacterium]|nr:chromate resistance protein [Candidatus Paceibacterota bacterium]
MAIPLRLISLVLLLGAVVSGCSRPASPPASVAKGQTYVTWSTLEPDKLASIWLIKRHLDPEAKFEFTDREGDLPPGIPFDVPQAEYRRYANHSCFEFILQKHKITDPTLGRIGALIHDLEVNYWGQKRFPESTVLAGQLESMVLSNSVGPEVRVQQALGVFDRLAESLRASADQEHQK